jgi:DNA polymerase-3 subunit delta
MLIFLYGQDNYRVREELRKIVGEYKKSNPDWLDFVRVDASDNQVEIFKELKQVVDTVSMFGAQKLIIIENVFNLNQESQEEILEFLKHKKIEDDKNTTIIFWAEEVDVKNAFYKFLINKAEYKEFNLLKGAQLRNWVKDYTTKQGGKIDGQAMNKLIEYVGNNLWRMANEINKLISFAMGATLIAADVELLVRSEIDLNIFELGDAIGQKNKAKAIKLFNQQIEEGENESYLLSMIASQIRNIIKIKSFLQINTNTKDSRILANKLGIHPFVAQKSMQQVRNFTLEELKKIYYQLTTIDFEAKIGKKDITTALELFISGL